MDFYWNCLLEKFQLSQLVCTPCSKRCKIKLDAEEKLFVLTTFSRFIGLSKVGVMQYKELLNKKLTGPGPEISVHPSVTLFLSFFRDISSDRKP